MEEGASEEAARRMTDAAKLKAYVERIDKLMEERDALLADIRDVLEDAKEEGFVPKIIRAVMRRRRAKDPAALAAEDDLLETYQGLLSGPLAKAADMAAHGATSRQIEQETGLDHSTVARSVALKKNGATAESCGVCGHASGHWLSCPHHPRHGQRAEPAVSVGAVAASSPRVANTEIDVTLPKFLDRRVSP